MTLVACLVHAGGRKQFVMSFSNWRVNLRSIQLSREQARRKLEARDFPADPMGSADAGGGEWNSGGWDR